MRDITLTAARTCSIRPEEVPAGAEIACEGCEHFRGLEDRPGLRVVKCAFGEEEPQE